MAARALFNHVHLFGSVLGGSVVRFAGRSEKCLGLGEYLDLLEYLHVLLHKGEQLLPGDAVPVELLRYEVYEGGQRGRRRGGRVG